MPFERSSSTCRPQAEHSALRQKLTFDRTAIAADKGVTRTVLSAVSHCLDLILRQVPLRDFAADDAERDASDSPRPTAKGDARHHTAFGSLLISLQGRWRSFSPLQL
jgi:hypothetical protein